MSDYDKERSAYEIEQRCKEALRIREEEKEPTVGGNKYLRKLKDTQVDVYDVLKAFNVTCPAIQHALKKMLCTGIRGHKDFLTDANEAIASLERAKELHSE